MKNLVPLRADMREKHIAVVPCAFKHNGNSFFLAICDLTDDEVDRRKKGAVHNALKYALVRLIFMKQDNLSDNACCYANSHGILNNEDEIKLLLGVVSEGEGDWFDNINRKLGELMPSQVPKTSDELVMAAKAALCIRSHYDPERTYRWSLILNGLDNEGNEKHRTNYNDQMASIFFPKLYELFKNQRRISFGFTADPMKERSEEEIYRSFTERHSFLD